MNKHINVVPFIMTIWAQPDVQHSIRSTHCCLLIIRNTTVPKKTAHNMDEPHKQKGIKEARLQRKNSDDSIYIKFKVGKINLLANRSKQHPPLNGSEGQENTLEYLWEILIFLFLSLFWSCLQAVYAL